METSWLGVIVAVTGVAIMMGINVLSERYDKIMETQKLILEKLGVDPSTHP